MLGQASFRASYAHQSRGRPMVARNRVMLEVAHFGLGYAVSLMYDAAA
jgi:hypothetical protein